jgi:AraC-like DNA-binding protein
MPMDAPKMMQVRPLDANQVVGDSQWPEELLSRQAVRRVFVCGRRVEPPLLSHVVNFPRLELPLSGIYENQIEVDGERATVQLKPGEALFAPPNCWNLPTWQQPVRLMSMLFGRKQMGISIVAAKSPAEGAFTVTKFCQPRPLTGPVPKILEAMIEVHAAGGPTTACVDLARALLNCVRESFLRPIPEAVYPTKSLLEDVCVYLQNHYQYDITRESVARQFGISPSYLSRVFQMQGHMTFSSYLMHVRTDRAKHLLRSYNLKLDDVSARCGWASAAAAYATAPVIATVV